MGFKTAKPHRFYRLTNDKKKYIVFRQYSKGEGYIQFIDNDGIGDFKGSEVRDMLELEWDIKVTPVLVAINKSRRIK